MFDLNSILSSFSTNSIPTLIFYVLLIVGQWKIFTKAGEAGWKSLIPIYNMYVLFKLIGMNYIKTLIIVVVLGVLAVAMPFIAIATGIAFLATLSALFTLVLLIYLLVVICKMCDNLSKAFGHGFGFAVGLFFLQPIFMIILGFNSDEYKGVPAKTK